MGTKLAMSQYTETRASDSVAHNGLPASKGKLVKALHGGVAAHQQRTLRHAAHSVVPCRCALLKCVHARDRPQLSALTPAGYATHITVCSMLQTHIIHDTNLHAGCGALECCNLIPAITLASVLPHLQCADRQRDAKEVIPDEISINERHADKACKPRGFVKLVGNAW